MLIVSVIIISLLLGFVIGQCYAYFKVNTLLKKCDDALKMSNEFIKKVLKNMVDTQN